MSSFALLLLAAPAPATAEQVIAAHRARTSVAALQVEAAARRQGDCRPEGEETGEDVLVCGRRDDGRYRVPASDDDSPRPGLGGMHSVGAGQETFGTCEIGANVCEKPVVDFMRVADVLIRGMVALTDGE